jgi:hypothetical protein
MKKVTHRLLQLLGIVLILGAVAGIGRLTRATPDRISGPDMLKLQAKVAALGGRHQASENDYLLQLIAVANAEPCPSCDIPAEFPQPQPNVSDCHWSPMAWTLFNGLRSPAFMLVPALQCHKKGESEPRYQPVRLLYILDGTGNFHLCIGADGILYRHAGMGWTPEPDQRGVQNLKQAALDLANAAFINKK